MTLVKLRILITIKKATMSTIVSSQKTSIDLDNLHAND